MSSPGRLFTALPQGLASLGLRRGQVAKGAGRERAGPPEHSPLVRRVCPALAAAHCEPLCGLVLPPGPLSADAQLLEQWKQEEALGRSREQPLGASPQETWASVCGNGQASPEKFRATSPALPQPCSASRSWLVRWSAAGPRGAAAPGSLGPPVGSISLFALAEPRWARGPGLSRIPARGCGGTAASTRTDGLCQEWPPHPDAPAWHWGPRLDPGRRQWPQAVAPLPGSQNGSGARMGSPSEAAAGLPACVGLLAPVWGCWHGPCPCVGLWPPAHQTVARPPGQLAVGCESPIRHGWGSRPTSPAGSARSRIGGGWLVRRGRPQRQIRGVHCSFLLSSPGVWGWCQWSESVRGSGVRDQAGSVWDRAPAVRGPPLTRPCDRIADELELIRPSVYRNVARQLNLSLQSETVVTDAFLAVAAQIFSAGITWGKVVSLYSVAAGLAVDCVRQAQPAMVHALVDCLGEFVRKTLATWLRRRGGWTDLLKCVVSADPGRRSHWLVAAFCSFGRFLKAAFFLLLPER
ncbi:bcl-2-related ovarian killer protein isoform X2 [Phacochoerus africanus]|uniref:bcl-2-related ovarian killer protein isoform X2 n=1 Tax=Phacochoerus africanus TaxID=41426 RepID=UPI001FDA4D00|nr:bcl-2-related ovarian killer protein isoform X2 [Phacochoerus africanus]